MRSNEEESESRVVRTTRESDEKPAPALALCDRANAVHQAANRRVSQVARGKRRILSI